MGSLWTCAPEGVIGKTRTGILTGGAGAEAGATTVAAITGIGLYAGIYQLLAARRQVCLHREHLNSSAHKNSKNAVLAGEAKEGDVMWSRS